jgi:hypothetical protein
VIADFMFCFSILRATCPFPDNDKSPKFQDLVPIVRIELRFQWDCRTTCCASFASGRFGFSFKAASSVVRPRLISPALA